jgi:Xaa-Pro aminopeptidase
MHRLRWVKSPAEVALMAASASAAADSVTACMAATSPGAREASLAALFEYRCRLRGAARCAYPSVVASGPDSCTIHYSRNDKVCRSGDLLLMDAGCELHGYASDVTRTWPVSGKFSGAQRQLYGVVLGAREKVLAAAVEGASLARLHALCVSLLSQGLLDLGLLRGMSLDAVMAGPYKLSPWPCLAPRGRLFFSVLRRRRLLGTTDSRTPTHNPPKSQKKSLHREFFCHSVGHALGLDVHDASAVGPARPLEAGVALALEPGLYVPDDARRFGPFAGLGIRLEDDVVISPGGEPPAVLSAAAPIEMDDVEHAVGQGQSGGRGPAAV